MNFFILILVSRRLVVKWRRIFFGRRRRRRRFLILHIGQKKDYEMKLKRINSRLNIVGCFLFERFYPTTLGRSFVQSSGCFIRRFLSFVRPSIGIEKLLRLRLGLADRLIGSDKLWLLHPSSWAELLDRLFRTREWINRAPQASRNDLMGRSKVKAIMSLLSTPFFRRSAESLEKATKRN